MDGVNRIDRTIVKPSLHVAAGSLRSLKQEVKSYPEEFDKYHVFDIYRPDVNKTCQSYRNTPMYVDDILKFLDQSEKIPQPQIIELMNPGFSRSYPALYDWLYSVFIDLDIVNVEVFLTAISTFNRCMQQQTFASELMQRACMLACLWISCKIEAQQDNPSLEAFLAAASGLNLKKKLLIDMESLVLNLLNFDLLLPTPRYFVRRYGRVCSFDMNHLFLCNYLCYLASRDIELFKYPPSLIAAGVVATCFRVTNLPFYWTMTMKEYSGYMFEDVKPVCVTLMKMYEGEQKQFGEDRRSSVRRATPIFYNYTSSSYMSVSTIELGDKWSLENKTLVDGSLDEKPTVVEHCW